MRRPLAPLAFVLAAALGTARAASWEYAISVPDGLQATFELPFPVEHAGTVTLEAEWNGARLLFFGVDAPGHPSISRRSGPSPQRIDLSADDATIALGTGWKLTIKALPARGEASGRLRITVPDAPEVVARREAELHPPPPPPPPPPAWTLAKAAPAGTTPLIAHVYEAVEGFRAAVRPAKEGPPDACVWQQDLLVDLAAARDRLGDAGAPPDLPTLRYFGRLAETIRRVDALRTSKDPVLAGPVPEDRLARRDWLIARHEVIRPIERSLDELTELLRGGHAPALDDETWLPRMTACLTACERYFDERVRLGSDDAAPNGELAVAQWDRMLAAARALESFGPFLKEPGDPGR